MSNQRWVAPVGPYHNLDGTALANSAALTDVSPAPSIILPGNTLDIGGEIELWASGQFSNTGTPTLVLGFYYGGIAGVALAATSALTTTTGATSWPWQLYWRGTVRAIGATGSIKGQGFVHLGSSLVAFTPRFIPETAALRTVTIDTSAAKAITVGAQWGTSSASNTLTCDDLSVKLIN
jgi:hypothetical protein